MDNNNNDNKYLKDNFNKAVGSNIKFIRKQHKLSQEKFAEAIGVSVQFISALERGLYSLSSNTMLNICNAMDCTPSDIFANLSENYESFGRNSKFLEDFECLSEKNQRLVIAMIEALKDIK